MFNKFSNVKFDNNLSSHSLVDAYRWMVGQTDEPSHMTNLTDTFHDCANVPKINGFIVALVKEIFNLLQQGLKQIIILVVNYEKEKNW
jgi:hypothetical protein